ncbi:MAG: CAP domain-containing protein [Pseudomonadota bacterium]
MNRSILIITILFTLIAPSLVQACAQPRLPSNANKTIDPKRINQALFSKVVTEYTNYYRCRAGRRSLRDTNALTRTASMQSKNMAQYNVLSHQTRARGEQTFKQRLKKNRVRIRAAAENITMDFLLATNRRRYLIKDIEACHFEQGGKRVEVHTYASLGRLVVQDWLASASHKKNSLNTKYARSGAAIAVSYTSSKPCGVVYVTQTFAN